MKLNRRALGLIFDSCSGHCFYCGVKIPPFSDWQVDHMNPVAQGGADTFYNVVVACRPCNSSKGNRTVEEFRAAIIRRALNQVTNAKEQLSRFMVFPDTDHSNSISNLSAAEDFIVNADIIFFGEAHCLPRKDDSLFSESMDTAMQEFDESEGEPNVVM